MRIRPFNAGLVLVFAAMVLTSGWTQFEAVHQLQQTGLFTFLPFIAGPGAGGTIPPPPNLSLTSVSAIYEFTQASLQRCHPNQGVTYAEGTIYKHGQPVDGYQVVFSYAPDGPIVAQVESGPHAGYPGWRAGYYAHIIGFDGPREGDWYFWIVDGNGNRISAIAHVHTDGGPAVEGACQQAVIDFDS